MAKSRQVDISDSDESMTGESMTDSLSSIYSDNEQNLSDHEEKPFDNLLECYSLKSACDKLRKGAYSCSRGIPFDTEEELLLHFLQNTTYLPIIRKVLQQNQKLAKKLGDKIYPEEEEEEDEEEDEEEEEEEEDECPSCGK